MPHNSEDLLNATYLINNCGYVLLNEIWTFNINKNKWTYIKPYFDSSQPDIIQKPFPRYGHTSVYYEKIDTAVSPNIIRKYMYVYGGFSIYCDKICDDLWEYEIAYAPQRYYPNLDGSSNWNKGNIWKLVNTSNSNSPGKRMYHTTIVDSGYIYLFGGITLDSKGNYKLTNDLWKFDLKSYTWEKIITQGISKVLRPVKVNLML